MRSLKPYRPFRFPLYPGRISTLHRAPKTDFYPSRCGQPSALPISGQDTKSGRLMIIEHEENRSRALAALLQSWGFLTVTHAHSACKSQRFNQNICDLVLLNGVFSDDIYAQFLSATKGLGQSILIFSQNMDDYKRLKILCDASGRSSLRTGKPKRSGEKSEKRSRGRWLPRTACHRRQWNIISIAFQVGRST